MTQSTEIDARTQKEIRVQTLQTLFHFTMAVIVAYGAPTEYLQNPVQTQINMFTDKNYQENNWTETWGVRIPYLLSTTYHCILYFWDPVTNTPLKVHHMASIFIGTVLLIYNHISEAFLVMTAVYILDLWNFFVLYKNNNQQNGQLLISSMIKIHHMVTLMLLGVSWVKNLTPFGMWILFIHDVTDVPMFIVRMLRKKNANFLRVVIVAVSVLITWAYYRVWCMFFLILEAIDILLHNPAVNMDDIYFYVSCVSGLSILFSFNVYWTLLVFSKAIKELIMGGKTSTNNE